VAVAQTGVLATMVVMVKEEVMAGVLTGVHVFQPTSLVGHLKPPHLHHQHWHCQHPTAGRLNLASIVTTRACCSGTRNQPMLRGVQRHAFPMEVLELGLITISSLEMTISSLEMTIADQGRTAATA